MQLFSHLEGIVIAPTIETLSRNKIIDTLIDMKKVSLNSISVSKNIQSGYINVALNSLASLGVVEKTLKSNDTIYTLTEYGAQFIKHVDSYKFYSKIKNHLNNFIINDIQEKDLDSYINFLENNLEKQLIDIRALYLNESNLTHRIAQHIEGVITVSYTHLRAHET